MKIKMAIVGLLAVPALTACATDAGSQRVSDCETNGDNAVGCTATIQYQGKPLNCVTWSGSHGEVGLTCDFVEYHSKGQ
jgi:hypothetical protein